MQRLQVLDDVGDDLIVFLEVLRRQGLAFELARDQAFLKFAVTHEILAHGVERLGDALAQFGFHRRHRHGAAIVEIVLGFGGLGFSLLLAFEFDLIHVLVAHALDGLGFLLGALGLGEFLGSDRRGGRRRSPALQHDLRVVDNPTVSRRIGRFEIDDITQEHALLGQFLAPHHDSFERERAFAQAADHRIAAGLDTLRDGDLALARQKLHRAHLAQIHPHRIVRTIIAVFRRGGERSGFRAGRSSVLALFAVFAGFLFAL